MGFQDIMNIGKGAGQSAGQAAGPVVPAYTPASGAAGNTQPFAQVNPIQPSGGSPMGEFAKSLGTLGSGIGQQVQKQKLRSASKKTANLGADAAFKTSQNRSKSMASGDGAFGGSKKSSGQADKDNF